MTKILENIESQLNTMNEKFDQMDQKMDRKFNQVDNKFEIIDKRFKNLENRFDVFNFQIFDMKKEINKQFIKTNNRIDELYKHVGGFIRLQKIHDLEITSLISAFERHDRILNKI